jgi:hypothetical protein
LKPGLIRWVDSRPGQPGAGTGPGWRKNRGRENPVWPGKTRSRPGCKPVDFYFFFVFFTKTMLFRFKTKKELTRPTRWLGQNPEPGPWTGPTTGLGLKTMILSDETSPFNAQLIDEQVHQVIKIILFLFLKYKIILI